MKVLDLISDIMLGVLLVSVALFWTTPKHSIFNTASCYNHYYGIEFGATQGSHLLKSVHCIIYSKLYSIPLEEI